MRRTLMLIMVFLIVLLSGCDQVQNTQSDLPGIKSYKEIPGITQEEISAIETFKKEKGSFSYGHLLKTESFKQPDDTYADFTIELTNLLSDFFGLKFVQVGYDEWASLKAGIDNRTIDFSSVSAAQAAELMNTYYMTKPISKRGLKIYTLASAKMLMSENDVNGFRIGFLKGTATADFIKGNYPRLSFNVVELDNYNSAAAMLESNIIDAFVMSAEDSSQYQRRDFIRSKDFFPGAYYPVSITTANPDLEPIISVINKYLVNGGSAKLFELYKSRELAYKKHTLFQSFTDEEKAYLKDLASRKAKVAIGIQHDMYPISFYNETSKQFEGVVIDVLAEITKLTGMEFDTTTTANATLTDILAKLKSDEISLMTQLLYTDSRKNDYLWSAIPYHTTNYALLSKSEIPNLDTYQVYYKRVGTLNKSAYEEMFDKWFPNHENKIAYSTTAAGFDALERGEIDLLMLCENMLLTLTHYREKSGFKVNFNFNEQLDSRIGFSNNEATLRSIVDKTLCYVETDKISNEWLTRNFDYSRKISKMQTVYLSIFLSVAVILLIAMFFLLLKNKRMRTNLLERTAKLSAIYASMPDTVFTKNTAGVYTSCNPSFEKQAGMSETEIVGKTYAEVFGGRASETAGSYKELDKKVLHERSTEIIEEMVLFPDGSRKFLDTLKAPLIQNGDVVGLLGIGRDITERKEMEAALQQAIASTQDTLAMFENIINTAQIAFVMTLDNIITQANEYSRSYMGMNIGDDIRSFYADATQRDKLIENLEHNDMIPNIIVKFNIADGKIHRFLSSVASFEYAQREVIIIWAMDIESDELKNDQIRTMQESMQTILDTLPVPVRIFDLETTEIVYVNDSLLELFEYDSADEIHGLKLHDMLSKVQSDGTNSDDCEKKIQNSLTVNPVCIELMYRSKTGRIIDALVVARLIYYKGRQAAISIIKDLTEEKERAQFLLNAAEREREANQSKSRFLANMSHEIRTPMNAIIGMSELLLNELLTDRQRGYVNDINTSAHSLLSIINDILDLSKIEAGKLELNPVDYDFHMFIDNIYSVFKFVTEKKGLEFRFETDGIMPKCLFGDDGRLRQVLTNICGNAVKFTSSGFIRLKVTSTDKTIMFEIEDTGIGVRKEDLPKLFDAFVQADAQKNRHIKGTGLGLSISKAFIDMMNGTISVNSVYGDGTTFTVVIPVVAGDESTIMYQDERKKDKPIFAPSAKILVVDDNELNLKVASGLLNMYKINADVVLSGREAIDLIQKTDYDIIFMDHMMPEMDGIEATGRIRKLGGKYKRLPIIALTANAVRGAREMFLASEFDGFISKPIDVNELSDILWEWLPREKLEIQTETVLQENTSQHNEQFLDSIKKIKGINTEIGLSRVSGNEDMYRETLEIFVKKLLAECEKMEGFLNNKDLHNFAILVHGMKSSLATIGAMKLSETAFLLETASKNKELDYCAEHLPLFLKNLRSLQEQLSAIMPEEEALASHPEGDANYLREHAQAALSAANDFEGDLAMEEINKLLEYDFGVQINELLKNAGNAIKDFDFDSAVTLLNEIIATHY